MIERIVLRSTTYPRAADIRRADERVATAEHLADNDRTADERVATTVVPCVFARNADVLLEIVVTRTCFSRSPSSLRVRPQRGRSSRHERSSQHVVRRAEVLRFAPRRGHEVEKGRRHTSVDRGADVVVVRPRAPAAAAVLRDITCSAGTAGIFADETSDVARNLPENVRATDDDPRETPQPASAARISDSLSVWSLRFATSNTRSTTSSVGSMPCSRSQCTTLDLPL